MEQAIEQGEAGMQESQYSVGQVVGQMIGVTTAVLRGEQPRAGVRDALEAMQGSGPLDAYFAALVAVLDEQPQALDAVVTTATAAVQSSPAAERANVLAGLALLASELQALGVELAARQQTIAAFREAGEDPATLLSLGISLHNLAALYIQQGELAAAVPLLEEVVQLGAQLNDPMLQEDADTLAQVQQALDQPRLTLRDAITQWKIHAHEPELAALINTICNIFIVTMQDNERAERFQLANDLAELRSERTLPLAGANDFLHWMQLRLRDLPGMAERAAQVQAVLPKLFADAIRSMERIINASPDASGAPAAPPVAASLDPEVQQEASEMARMMSLMSQLDPAQQQEMIVMAQAFALLRQSGELLQTPAASAERQSFAEQLDSHADHAQSEPSGSPAQAAAEAYRAAAALLRGAQPDLAHLHPLYRDILERFAGGAA